MKVESIKIYLNDENIRGLDPRPDPNPILSNITAHFGDGSQVTMTEEFLRHMLELIEFDRKQRIKRSSG